MCKNLHQILNIIFFLLQIISQITNLKMIPPIYITETFFRNCCVHLAKARKLSLLRIFDWIRFCSLIYFKHVSVQSHVLAISVQGERSPNAQVLTTTCLPWVPIVSHLSAPWYTFLDSFQFTQSICTSSHAFCKAENFSYSATKTAWTKEAVNAIGGGSVFTCLSCSWTGGSKYPMGQLPLKAII